MKLKDKIAVITGSGSGLGRAYALELSSNGSKIIVADINLENAENVCDEINDKSEEKLAYPFKVDVKEKEEVKKMINFAIDQFGKVDILINNAGVLRPAMTHKMSEEDWNLVIDVNQKGTFLCTQAVIPFMKEAGSGKIINITSGAGLMGDVGQVNYSSSKAAIIGLTKSWARELGRYNITVNALSPIAATEATKGVFENPKFRDKYLEMIPLRRFAEPEEIAKALTFLVSDDASYITGVILRVDGGRATGV